MKQEKIFMMLLLFLGLIMNSCNKENEEQSKEAFYINNVFYIKYVNMDGINILQNDSQIEIYYEKNGIAERVARANLDHANGYVITSQQNVASDGPDELCVAVFSSDYLDNENISKTYVKLGNNQMDTIQCQFHKSSEVLYVQRIWHNGTPVWDIETAKAKPLIRIIK